MTQPLLIRLTPFVDEVLDSQGGAELTGSLVHFPRMHLSTL